MSFAAIIFLFLFNSYSNAAIEIPKDLSRNDQREVVQMLGFGTSGKILSDPYPLGGYSGLEVGLSLESVPIDDLSRLGSKGKPTKNFTYPKFSFGKGLYNNLDIFLHFIPFNENTNITEYGGLLRWCFLQAKFLPATFSFLFHSNSTNVGNLFVSQTTGAELQTGVNVNNVAIYIGAGPITSTATFNSSIVKAGENDTTTVSGFHSFVGGSLNYDRTMLALQIDQYNHTVFSAKLAARF